ncbi:MAG: helix-turn-helix transcriptional regulator [Candidatus Thorarchaeota archaeon]|nr:helix-turn-helix transcriptional regulator [Candidatus Thorarchaeota archaeon]
MSKKKDRKEYEDMIRYEPVPILVLKKEEANQVIWDLNHSAILRILRGGPMTIVEIAEEFNKSAKKDDAIKEKAATTIYRYVKTLEDVGLITQAGRRVHYDKNATEILYCRTAKVFQNMALPTSYWTSERGRVFYSRLYTAIKGVFEGYEADEEMLSDFIVRFERGKEKHFERVLPRLDENELAHITGGDWWEIEQTIQYSGLFGLLLNEPEIVEDLRKCFKKVKG